jgi:hypothetical protein
MILAASSTRIPFMLFSISIIYRISSGHGNATAAFQIFHSEYSPAHTDNLVASEYREYPTLFPSSPNSS